MVTDLTKEELGALIISSERQLYVTAKSILRDDQNCADALQESIVKAFSNIKTLKKNSYAKTWLIRILINECYNIIRKNAVYVSLEDTQMESIPVDETEDYSELYMAVNTLKDELRIPVILYYIDELSIREIAQILEISEGAVQKRLARARGKLKRSIDIA